MGRIVCEYYLQNKCSKDKCRFSHVHPCKEDCGHSKSDLSHYVRDVPQNKKITGTKKNKVTEEIKVTKEVKVTKENEEVKVTEEVKMTKIEEMVVSNTNASSNAKKNTPCRYGLECASIRGTAAKCDYNHVICKFGRECKTQKHEHKPCRYIHELCQYGSSCRFKDKPNHERYCDLLHIDELLERLDKIRIQSED